tara:strand:- start:2156 stop:3271 length:1116 start_codon:yes stop_codon:yes gene_type:complete
MSAKKEAMLEEEEEEKEEDDSVPRQLPPKLSPMRKRGEVLTPPSRLLGEETRYSSSEEEEEELTFTTKMEDDANKIDEEYFASEKTTNKNTSGVSAEATTTTVNKRLDGMTLNREEEEKYMRRNPRRGVVSSSGVAASSPWEEEYGKPMILPEAKPIGSYPMTDLEKRTLELRADPAAKDDLERAIHLAMERATIPINGSVGKTVVSKKVVKEEEEEEEEDLKRAAAHSRKLVALQNRDFRSVENVAEIRESAARVKTWFRALGVELNENVLVSARDDDENETDTFARLLTKAATDGSLLKEIVESESKVRIPSSVFAASSSITEGVLKHLRTVPGVKPRFLWCQDEIETGVDVEATVGLFDDIRTCGRWR